MSHFTVLVVTDTPEEVDEVLQPFHEYECTGVKDEYVVWVDGTEEVLKDWETVMVNVLRNEEGKTLEPYDRELRRDATPEEIQLIQDSDAKTDLPFNYTAYMKGVGGKKAYYVYDKPEGYELVTVPYCESGKYDTVDDFAENYHGYSKKDGKFGCYTNPNAKWDWWMIGGRWSGFFKLKDGKSGTSGRKPLIMGGGESEGIDQARKSDIDFEAMMKQKREGAAKDYDQVMKVVGDREIPTFAKMKAIHEDRDEAAKALRDHPVYQDLRNCEDVEFFLIANLEEFDGVSREQYIKNAALSAITTFAVLVDEMWLERGQMGWFAHVSNEDEKWSDNYMEILDNIPDDKLLTLVDCHI